MAEAPLWCYAKKGGSVYAPLAVFLLSLLRIWIRDVLPSVDHRFGAKQARYHGDHFAELLFRMDDDWLGSRAGVGSEDRRSHGGAVNPADWRRFLGARFSILLVALLTSFAACSRKNDASPPDAAARLGFIAPADPSRYPSLQEAKHWSNPYLVVRADNVRLLTDIAANEEQILKPGEVLNALAQLPASAWPYGRAVAILLDERQSSSEQDKVALRRNRGIVEGELQDAHVAIRWIPNS
jgi:hypothetical protein